MEHVTVLFFAKSRELTEQRSAQIFLHKQVTGKDLVSSIVKKFPSKLKRPGLQMADDTIVITPDHLHIDQVTEIVGSPSAGAVSIFVGTTRDNFEGKTVVRLEYEAYVPMARSEMRKICKQVREKWDVIKIAIFHRIGVVPIGEASVIVAVSSAHRKNSLEATHYCIDTLKATVPIWKKEVYEQGEPNWKENTECFWKNKGGSSKQSTV
ncbi:molybdopterin synthase catalytic subunit-like isoform X2 [Montipora capricornis]|uniref:molybdopterin synthase catalytic subunit-like isoform X2 n=1 Tax=Montipora foliosa TaxID=591990 RepID=UPI0035F1055B